MKIIIQPAVLKGCASHLSKHDPPHWEKAKQVVSKQYGLGSGDRFYALVNAIYQKMSHYLPKAEAGKYRWKPTGGKTAAGTPKATKVRSRAKILKMKPKKQRRTIKPAKRAA